ncbi:hypothetical protein GE107_14665 [Cohnella sp. CFH 77786]|nr:hypothetical protein [Cohnella sp. CFH 77786]
METRSWIYDDALAVIAFSLSGDRKRASSILDSLSQLQRSDGSLDMSYDIYKGEISPLIRSGSLAWVGYSALKYELVTKDKKYRKFAIRIADYLLTQQNKKTGSIRGGPDVKWYSTEHNIDCFFFFRELSLLTRETRFERAAESVKEALLNFHWSAKENRFFQGVDDPAGALDTNSWGGIFLLAIGRTDLLQGAMNYLSKFKVDSSAMTHSNSRNSYNMTFMTNLPLSGYKPYLDNEHYPGAPDIIWTEGTWGVINLMQRQQLDTWPLIRSMFAIQSSDPEGGLVYANRGAAQEPFEFHVWPAVAATAWQYFTLRGAGSIW